MLYESKNGVYQPLEEDEVLELKSKIIGKDGQTTFIFG